VPLRRRPPQWKAYEAQIAASLRRLASPDANVTFDDRGTLVLPGRFSGIDRQVDVLVEGRFAGLPEIRRMIVDCKCFSRNVDVQAVEAFAGFLDDVNVELGLLVTTAGFSEAARRRAEHVRGLRLDVVELDELAKWLPRRPTVAHTSGTNTATLTYTDGDGTYTEVVSVAFAQRLLGEMYPDNEPV
jgi:hypothetical protein